MRIVLFSTVEDYEKLAGMIKFDDRATDIFNYSTTEQFIPALMGQTFDAVLIYHDGALGMEAAIAARKSSSKMPILWFSDDRYFAPQAYRIGITWFGLKSLTVEKLVMILLQYKISCTVL